MKRSSTELKKFARATLKGKYGIFVGTYVIYLLISVCESYATLQLQSIASKHIYLVIQFLLSSVLQLFFVGLAYQAMKACRGKQLKVSDLFYAFSHNPDRFIKVALLQVVVLFIPTLPLYFIPGSNLFANDSMVIIVFYLLFLVASILLIILNLALTLSYYLIIDCPEMTSGEAIRTSIRLMKGNKGRAFYISLSFIGLILLGICSFGIGLLWLAPYMNVTSAYFYFDVIGALDPPAEKIAQETIAPIVEAPVIDTSKET